MAYVCLRVLCVFPSLFFSSLLGVGSDLCSRCAFETDSRRDSIDHLQKQWTRFVWQWRAPLSSAAAFLLLFFCSFLSMQNQSFWVGIKNARARVQIALSLFLLRFLLLLWSTALLGSFPYEERRQSQEHATLASVPSSGAGTAGSRA